MTFLHLTVDHELITKRMTGRDHFMPTSLLESQERPLDPLEDDEHGWAFDIAPLPGTIVEEFIAGLEISPGGHA